jgi:glutaredoxin
LQPSDHREGGLRAALFFLHGEVMSPVIHVISKRNCSYCALAKGVLRKHGLRFEEKILETNTDIISFLESGLKTVPQIYVNGSNIGGYEDLLHWIEQRETEAAR